MSQRLRLIPAGAIAIAMGAVAGVGGTSAAFAQDAPDVLRGRRLFLQCQACHSLQAAAAGTVGPPLSAVVGRKAAGVSGYPYSAALSASGLVWDEATLDKWLGHPNALVPGTKMIFAGVANQADRKALIAYLSSETPHEPSR